MLMAAELPLAASSRELAALLVSLAGSQRVAEELARGGRLEQLLELVVGPAEPVQSLAAAGAGACGPGAGDELLWKLLQTLASHDSEPVRALFGPALLRLAWILTVRPGTCGLCLQCPASCSGWHVPCASLDLKNAIMSVANARYAKAVLSGVGSAWRPSQARALCSREPYHLVHSWGA